MISLIAKGKKLTALAEPLLKSEGIGFRIRTSFNKNILFTRNIYKKESYEQDLQDSENQKDFGKFIKKNIFKKEIYEQDLQDSGYQKDFGKVVELSEDFDEVRIEETERKWGRKEIKLGENFKVDTTTKSNEKIIESKMQELDNLNKYNKDGEITKSNEKIIESKMQELDNLNKYNKEGEIKYMSTPLNVNSSLFSSLMTELKSRKNREKYKEIILEGKRLIHDAVCAGCKPKKIFFSRTETLENLQLPKEVKIYKMPYKNFGVWSDIVTSPGIIGIFEMPKISFTSNNVQPLPLTVICDNVRDPKNLGSMLRVVAAVGCEKLILTKGCVDIWEPKVLRAAAGAHFRFPIVSNFLWSDIEREICEKRKILLADLSINFSCNQTSGNEDIPENNSKPFRRASEFSQTLPIHCYYSLKYGDESTVIIIGGETQGVSDQAYKFTLERKGRKIFIPMSNKIESLNNAVALGILLYEFRRQFDLISGAESHLSTANCD